jgi:iron complex transport system ATP-binding protein
MMDLLAQDLQVTLEGNHILKGVTLEAGAGKLVGVIGPNGSGKSTLLKCLYRQLAPQVGAVYLNGRDLSRETRRESAKQIGVVAQHNDKGFDFMVLDMVLLGRSPHKKPLERDTQQDYAIAQEALREVGLEELAHRSMATLSGGERQRVILARALAQQTPVLILDEPTNHLDVQYQLQLMELVKGLSRTVVAALHDLNLAAMYCQKLCLLEGGRVVAQGTPEEVLTPERIRAVYGVGAEVVSASDGHIRVLFYPR